MDHGNNKIQIVYGDATLGLYVGKIGWLFSYAAGGPTSFTIAGHEWLYRAARPTFWRATTDNDRGNGFPQRSGMWLAADQFLSCDKVEISVNGQQIPLPMGPENNYYSQGVCADHVQIAYTYKTITIPATKVQVVYDLTAEGKMKVTAIYYGMEGLPELPVFGMRFVAPTLAAGYTYQGLSGETYPDRMAGGIEGIYEIEGLPVTPYLVPQDCGMHMETKWVAIERTTTLNNRTEARKSSSIKVTMDQKPFAFSCLPYTAEELENATHQEELPLARRTVLCVCGAVRGVGGIDSWGSDVEETYRIAGAKDISFSFIIEGIDENRM